MTDQGQTEQAQLEKELVRRTRRLSAIYTVLTAYHQVDDLDEMMQLVLSQVIKISAGSVGSIHLLDEAGETLHLAAHQGMSASVLDVLRRIPAKGNIISDILTHKEPLIFTEIPAEPSLTEIAQVIDWDVLIIVPVVNGKTAWGVLTIYGDKTLQATAEEIELLAIIAGQIGIGTSTSAAAAAPGSGSSTSARAPRTTCSSAPARARPGT